VASTDPASHCTPGILPRDFDALRARRQVEVNNPTGVKPGDFEDLPVGI
jgi:hypothetical protein